jgi:hypothetical protein
LRGSRRRRSTSRSISASRWSPAISTPPRMEIRTRSSKRW